MGKRTSEQAPLWVAATELPVSPSHPFYARLTATDHREFPYQRILERAALVVDPRNATYGLSVSPSQVIRL